MKRTLSFLAVAIFALFILNSCSKDDVKKDEKPMHQPVPGMGETPGELQGAAFNLPNGVQLVGEIKGYISGDVCSEISTGSYVDVYFTLKNTTASTITVNIPAGLTFKALSDKDQSGLVIQNETISIASGKSCLVVVYAYCTNASRSGSSSDSKYIFGPVTNAPEMVYLINLCKNKKLEEGILQDIIWNITDYEGLSELDITFISELPNK